MNLNAAKAVFLFECRRTLTASRLTAWCTLAAFPPLIAFLLRLLERERIPDQPWGIFLFVLVPEVVCLLGLLLWATPMIQSELEGRTWIYLAVRPSGRVNVLLGKYATAFVWTSSAAWCGLSIALAIAMPREYLRMWMVFTALTVLSCMSYGAIYCFFAAMFHKRAMVIAVAYTMTLEFLVTLIPAMINQLTVNYRLRSLLFIWMNWWDDADVPPNVRLFIDDGAAWPHIVILIGLTAGFLTAAYLTVRYKEYVSSVEV